MREMKDSGVAWIGKRREHWEIYQISTIFSNIIKYSSHCVCNNLPLISYGNVVRKNVNTSDRLLP